MWLATGISSLRGLLAHLDSDKERLALWLPVAFGAGAVSYFRLLGEPGSLWPIGIGLAGALALWAGRSRPVTPILAFALLIYAAGWGWSQIATHGADAPVLDAETRPVDVQGRIVDLEPRTGGTIRAILDQVTVSNLAPDETPLRIRITFRPGDREARPGDLLQGLAILRPPPPPVAPGGFDFQRQAYFAQIGAVGFTLGSPAVTPGGETGGWDAGIAIEQIRRAIGANISAALTGADAALASALVIGERGQISDTDRDALRDAGLAHLLAISGLHIGIVGGFVFWGLRAALALVPALAVRYPIKKWAAMTALACALVYMLIAGATPPTQRAFLMIAIGLLAIMIDRNPISMRMVAVAAIGVILLSPVTVLGPSFQLSFAAVVALIAAFEWVEARKALIARGSGGARNRPLLYLGAVTYSTLIATVSTAPFALFHFQQVALYGVAANLVAVPLMAFWVMPMLAIGCIAALAGFGEIGFVPAGWGIAAVRAVAHAIADLPGAVFRAPQAGDWTIALVTLGGLWLCLWRSRLRWLGAAPVAAGLIGMALAKPPDILVSGFGDPVGLLPGDGHLYVPSLRRDQFTTTSWARMAGLNGGQDRRALPTDNETAAADQRAGEGAALRCDAFGCTLTRHGTLVAIAGSQDALADDCRLADLVVQLYPGGNACPAGTPTIRYLDLVIEGAHALRLGDGGAVMFESVGDIRGNRPWVATNR